MGLRSIGRWLACLALVAVCGAAAPVGPLSPAAPSVSPSGPLPAQSAAPELTKGDVDSWLDGMMPYAIATGDIAGVVLVVVKDGQVLTEKGYGYADVASRKPMDPASTLVRPGSVSKLFTWTAVMQQVQAGKLDLDRDVNAYLDFTIPPFHGQPITLRNLMTHTPGFEEQLKHDFVLDRHNLYPLRKFVLCCTPQRIYAPGTVPAYSNYGAALAGYIVERVSGEPFPEYIQRHVFQPLGMDHSSFVQPLPAALVPLMSKGYLRASQPPKPYELINVGPAGSLSTSADDMSRFMIAQLQQGQYNGARILDPATVAQMQAQQPQLDPPLPAMALGFYHEDRNGLTIVGHAGDTNYFHSDLHLLLDKHIGLFISSNSLGKEGAAGPVREAFFHAFLDRYFPASAPRPPTAPTAKAHAAMVQGLYWWSRRIDSNFFRVLYLADQAKVVAKPDGTITVSDLLDYSRAPKVWREVAPFRWVAPSGSTLVAVVRNGKVANLATDDLPPVMVLQPVPPWAQSSWNLPALGASLAVLVLMVLLWPVQALVRRRYGQKFALVGARATLYRLTRFTALAQIAGLVAYAVLISLFISGKVAADDSLDPLLIAAQVLCIVGALGALIMAANAVVVWSSPGRSWWARLSSTLILLAGVYYAWFVVVWRLARFGLSY